MWHAILENSGVTVALILLFGVSIFVHEFGHFLVARLFRLVIDVFAIGFGPALWKTKRQGILYKIGCIPIGGYVALPQLDPEGMSTVQGSRDDEKGEPPRRLPPISAGRKIGVSLAGAAGNIVLAVIIAWIVYAVGIPAGPAERSAALGYVDSESEAYAQGLRIGDVIEQVNSQKIGKWSDFLIEAALSGHVEMIARAPSGEIKTLSLGTEKGPMGEHFVPGIDGRNLCTVLTVEAGGSADQAGLRPGDTIVAFDGVNVFSRAHLVQLVDAARGRETPIQVLRPTGSGTTAETLRVTPAMDETLGRARIGIIFNTVAVEHDTVIHPRPKEQLTSHASAIFRFLRALTTPREAKAASGAVGGPVAIIASYWVIAKTSLMLAVWFTGFLNVNLAILNLLPIPVLDGGHILFSLWEIITRRPVPARVVNALVNAFAILLIVLFALLSVRDVDRFTPAGRYLRRLVRTEQPPAPEAGATVTNQPPADTAAEPSGPP